MCCRLILSQRHAQSQLLCFSRGKGRGRASSRPQQELQTKGRVLEIVRSKSNIICLSVCNPLCTSVIWRMGTTEPADLTQASPRRDSAHQGSKMPTGIATTFPSGDTLRCRDGITSELCKSRRLFSGEKVLLHQRGASLTGDMLLFSDPSHERQTDASSDYHSWR
jgi:hypothetical protein